MIPINLPFKQEMEQHQRTTGHSHFQILGIKKGKVRVFHCKDCEEVKK